LVPELVPESVWEQARPEAPSAVFFLTDPEQKSHTLQR
jgi:hypothetical protein